MMMDQDDEFAPYEVFDGTAWEAGLLKSILDDNNIESFMKDVLNNSWNILPVRASSAKVFVAHKDFDIASGIVGEFMKNMAKENEKDLEEG